MVVRPWLCLLALSPLLLEDGTPYPVHVASTPDRKITALNEKRWVPALTALPILSLSLFNGDFGAAVDPGAARFQLQMGALRKLYPQVDACYWPNAPVTLYVGRSGDAWPWREMLVGRISTIERKDETLQISVAVDTEPFAADVLADTYDGLGGPWGSADLKGRPKPLVMGLARSVEPVLIDAVNSIYQFSGYGPIESVDTLFERASDFGASIGDFADFTALEEADIPAGRWATCLAEGLVRLGAPAFGVITGDVKGHAVAGTTPRRTGAMINALADIAGVDPALLDGDSLDALDVRVPYDVNVVVQEQTSFFELARRMALPCNHQAGVALTGQFFVARPDLLAGAEFTLDAQGRRAPQVVEAREVKTSPPYAKITMGAERAWRVHSSDEIAFNSEIVDVGLYNEATTYREGQIVTMGDGSRWIYINPVPSAGNEPPIWPITSNPWWRNLTPPTRIANGQLLLDDTFDPRYWPEVEGVTRVHWNSSRAEWAANIAFVPDTPVWKRYRTDLPRMPRTFPGKRLFQRLTAQPWGVSEYVVIEIGDDTVELDTGSEVVPVEIGLGGEATFPLYLAAFQIDTDGEDDGDPIIIGEFDPADGEFTMYGSTDMTQWGYADFAIGYPAMSGDYEGMWSAFEPWESEYEPTADVTGTIPEVPETVIACDWTGAPKQDLATNPKTVQFSLLRGNEDVTAAATWSAVLKAGAMNSTIQTAGDANPGRLSITLFEVTSTVTISATYQGQTYSKDHKVVQQKDAAPTTGGTSGGGGGGSSSTVSSNGSLYGAPGSTTMVALGDGVTIVAGASGSVTLSADYEFTTNRVSGSQQVYLRWYQWNGTADVAIGTEVVSTSAYLPTFGEPGRGRCNLTVSGLTPGNEYTFHPYGRSNGSYISTITGDCQASTS